jgi:hypothetical protein
MSGSRVKYEIYEKFSRNIMEMRHEKEPDGYGSNK